MLAELVLAYTIDNTVPDTGGIEQAVTYLQAQAKEHGLAFPLPNRRITFTINPEGVPKGFMGFNAMAYAATNLDPCLIVFVEPKSAMRQSVIRHEILHCLGVPHSDYKLDLMFTTSRNQELSKRELLRWKRKP